MSDLPPELDTKASSYPDAWSDSGPRRAPATPRSASEAPGHERRVSRGRQAARVLVFVAAVAIALIGVGAGALGMLVSLVNPSADQVIGTTASAAILVLAGGLGLCLAWQALQAILGRGSSPFRPRRTWLWLLVFLLAVLGGQMVLSLDLLPALTLPPFHIAAAALPALFVLGAAGRSLGGATRWREIVLELSSGAFISTILAFVLEMVVVAALFVVVFAVVAMQPDGLEKIQALAGRLQDPTWLQDPAVLAPLASSPIAVIIALLFFAVVIPVVEESVKTVGVGLLSDRRPSLAQGFLWGMACGAGFAIAEGLFNSVNGLDVWALVISMRVGATVLHAFTGALMGMAWYYALMERRWLLGVGLFGASVGVHGLWNMLAAGVTLLSLAALESDLLSALPGGSSLGIMVIMALLALLGGLVALGLAGLTRFVRKRSPDLSPLRP